MKGGKLRVRSDPAGFATPNVPTSRQKSIFITNLEVYPLLPPTLRKEQNVNTASPHYP